MQQNKHKAIKWVLVLGSCLTVVKMSAWHDGQTIRVAFGPTPDGTITVLTECVDAGVTVIVVCVCEYPGTWL